MAEFFDQVAAGSPGLGVFLNAGDPPLDQLFDVLTMLDARRVDCVELAVPFPDSVTDGPVIKASARRALSAGVGLEETLRLVDAVRPWLAHTRIALMLDWAYTVREPSIDRVVQRVARSAVDGLLVHAVPPAVRPAYYRAAAGAGVPLVTTCYPSSDPATIEAATLHGSAYVYVVSRFGKSGGTVAIDEAAVTSVVERLHLGGVRCPVALGFGVRTAADVAEFHRLGADAVIVGSAFVAHLDTARSAGRPIVEELATFVDGLRAVVPQPAALSSSAASAIQPTE
jgi:tryptophan synthase alpha chain